MKLNYGHFHTKCKHLPVSSSNLYLETWFQPVLNIVGSHEPIGRKAEYSIPPGSKSTQCWTSSVLNMRFTWAPSAANTTTSWAQYKVSTIRLSSQMDKIGLLSKYEKSIIKSQTKIEHTVWILFHPITNVTEPFTHYKVI